MYRARNTAPRLQDRGFPGQARPSFSSAAVKYCKTCLYPDTKPDLVFDSTGVCSACRSYQERATIDWDVRARQFNDVVAKTRSGNGANYDCLIPVGGGKDSTYQVIRCLQAGLNPLCVTATTCDLSGI